MRNVLAALGRPVEAALRRVGGAATLGMNAFCQAVLPPYQLRAIAKEIDVIGIQSLGVVGIVGLFTGMVLVVQTGFTLQRFRAEVYVGELVALAVFREIGPVLAGLMVAGRVGSGIAAEIGSMQITEQIDAMRALGASPIKKIVVPKFVAIAISLPLLTMVGDILGILGGMIVANATLGLDYNFYLRRVIEVITPGDFISGVAKTFFFGLIIAAIASNEGFHTQGGTVGVARATTATVVLSYVLIIVADLVLTTLFISFGGGI